MLASLAIIGGCWQKKAKLREGSKKMNGNFHTFADPSLPPALLPTYGSPAAAIEGTALLLISLNKFGPYQFSLIS